MDIRIQRSSKRRTVALRVTPDGVTLLAPESAPEAELRRWAETKRAWIEKHRASFAARTAPARRYTDGETLGFLGETLTLRRAPRRDVARLGDVLEVPDLAPERVRAAVERWYGREALAFFTPLAHEMAARLGRVPSAVRLTNAKTRWGSCTASGELRFNPRVLLGPREVAVYLCAHEVAHLRELNHSPRFWRLVETLMPGHAAARARLRAEGWRFSFGGGEAAAEDAD